MNNEFFYCYSPRLKNHLLSKGERFICVGVHERTGKKFWLFPQTERLGEILTEWKSRKVAQ